MKMSWKLTICAICLLGVGCGKSNNDGAGGTSVAEATSNQGGGAPSTSATTGNNLGAAGSTSLATAGSTGKRGSAGAAPTAGKGSAGKKAGGTVAGGSAPAAGGSKGGTGAAGTQQTPVLPPDGTLPPVSDVWSAGPFGVATLGLAGPTRDATVFYPQALGQDGIKHPIVSWGNGKGQYGTTFYASLTRHVASHGFVVYTSYGSTDEGTELLEGLNWMIAENDRKESEFYQKLDVTKLASMGHSQGSLASFAISSDPRITTTVHLSGGTNPDLAAGHEPLAKMHAPAAFLCGENIPGGDGLMVGDVASQWCQYDFENAPVPVFFAVATGMSHITAPFQFLGALVGWYRWHLTGDTNIKKLFVGSDCELCSRRGWVVQQKDLK